MQTVSTCERDENVTLDQNETRNVMNLNYLEKSPYLKYPIWFLGTMKNTECPIPTGYSGWKVGAPRNVSHDSVESASQRLKEIGYTIFCLRCVLNHLI